MCIEEEQRLTVGAASFWMACSNTDWYMDLQVRPVAEDEMFKVLHSGKRKKKAWKRMVTKVTFVGPSFTRKPPKYERFIRPSGKWQCCASPHVHSLCCPHSDEGVHTCCFMCMRLQDEDAEGLHGPLQECCTGAQSCLACLHLQG